MKQRTPLPRRKAYLRRTVRMRARNAKRAARRAREYNAFINSPQWRQQKRRVHERDGWQCTTIHNGVRCGYTKDDGPLHAHHERYHPRGIEYTLDKDIRSCCPPDHASAEKQKWWKHPKPY